jgi:hypothetical protein
VVSRRRSRPRRWWRRLRNGRHATFFNLWAGQRRHLARYRAELRAELGQVLALLAEGAIDAQIAATFPLAEAAAALRDAESGGLAGKVVLLPAPAATRTWAVLPGGARPGARDRTEYARDAATTGSRGG